MSQQSSVPTSIAAAYAGLAVGDGHGKRSFVNDLGSAAQVNTIQITAAASTAYAFTIDGYSVAFTSDANGLVADIRDGLIAAGRAVPELEDLVSFNQSGNDIKVTAKTPGTGFTYADSDSNLATTAVTANASRETIPFGRAVVKRTGGNSVDSSCRNPSADNQIFLGVAERVHSAVDPSAASAATTGEGYRPQAPVTVIHRGEVWVEVEEAIAVGDSAFFRHTSGAGGTVVGKFRNDSDTDSCDEITGARFMSSTTGAGLARLALNTP